MILFRVILYYFFPSFILIFFFVCDYIEVKLHFTQGHLSSLIEGFSRIHSCHFSVVYLVEDGEWTLHVSVLH